MGPTQTFDTFEYTGPSGVSSYFTSGQTSKSYQTTSLQTSSSGQIVSARVQGTDFDERGAELPEFIGTLGADKSSTITANLKDEGIKPSWKDTSWSERENIEIKEIKGTGIEAKEIFHNMIKQCLVLKL